MPNWTFNRIKFTGPKEDLSKLIGLMGSDFEFDALIPMPESLNVTSGGREDEAIIAYVASQHGGIENLLDSDEALSFLRSTHEYPFDEKFMMNRILRLKESLPKMDEAELETLLEEGRIYVDNIKKYGASSWYRWRCKHWGTKWPASDTSIEETRYSVTWRFDTAWNSPWPIIGEIEKRFPSLSYEFGWQDEDDFLHSHVLKYYADNAYEDENGEWQELPPTPITNISVAGSDENNWFWDIGLEEDKEYEVWELYSLLENRFLRDDIEEVLGYRDVSGDDYKECVKRAVSIAAEGLLNSTALAEIRNQLIEDAVDKAVEEISHVDREYERCSVCEYYDSGSDEEFSRTCTNLCKSIYEIDDEECPKQIRCTDCINLVEGDDGEWICDDFEKEIHHISDSTCSIDRWKNEN